MTYLKHADSLIEMRDLQAVAKSIIGSRIAIRSSGRMPKDDRSELVRLREDVYKLDRYALEAFIDFHAKILKDERM